MKKICMFFMALVLLQIPLLCFNHPEHRAIPDIRPYNSYQFGYCVSGKFGEPRIDKYTGEHYAHTGIDYAIPYGTSVNSTCDGRVSFAGMMRGYGLVVTIEAGEMNRNTWIPAIKGHKVEVMYCHLSKQLVLDTFIVQKNNVICRSGNSGDVPAHLHYEVRIDGKPVFPFIKENQVI